MKNKYLIMTLACLIMVSCNKDGDNGKIQGHEYVDLGLPSGIKWATCNVGAKSPEESGHRFAWGETSPKNEYTKENSLLYNKKIKDDISGNAEYDAAKEAQGLLEAQQREYLALNTTDDLVRTLANMSANISEADEEIAADKIKSWIEET